MVGERGSRFGGNESTGYHNRILQRFRTQILYYSSANPSVKNQRFLTAPLQGRRRVAADNSCIVRALSFHLLLGIVITVRFPIAPSLRGLSAKLTGGVAHSVR